MHESILNLLKLTGLMPYVVLRCFAHFKALCQELSGGMAGGAKTTARERKEKQTEASLVHALGNFLGAASWAETESQQQMEN